MKKAVVISVCFAAIFLIGSVGCAQRPVGYQKIDPVLLAQLKASTKAVEKTAIYPCIVYTKTSKPLQQMGIHPDSIFPTFLTARLTKNQIFQLVKTQQVTYIASPKPDQPQLDGAGIQSF